jgi:hypothetical protein
VAGEACDYTALVAAAMRMPRGAKKWLFHSDRAAWIVRRREGPAVLLGVGGEVVAASSGVLGRGIFRCSGRDG